MYLHTACKTQGANEDFTVTNNFNEETSTYMFNASFKENHYKTATWVVKTSGRNVSVITAHLDSPDTFQTRLFTVVNGCSESTPGFCEISLLLKETAINRRNADTFDVAISFSDDRENMRGCEVKNIKINGLLSLVLLFLF